MGWLILYYTLELLKWLIIIRAVLSWFVAPHSRHPAVELLRRITDPVIRPIAAVLPDFGGIDISPLAAFFLIVILQRLIIQIAFF